MFAPDMEALSFNCNLEMIALGRLVDDVESTELCGFIEEHHAHTDSAVAKRLLDNWDLARTQFVRVIPRDYEKIIMARQNSR